MHSSRFLALPLIVCLSHALGAQAAAVPNDAVAEAEVREVVERFRAAIVGRDGASLRALFLPQGGAWLSVDRRAAPAGGAVSLELEPGSFEAFARSIEQTARRQEEVFTDVDIRTDGAVASVDFDFVYAVDGKPVNRGLEAWHLAKTDAGWKIVSLVYSSNPPR